MANFSFDIVSEFDKAELNNVYDQVKRELDNRYDFKGTPADVDWLNPEKTGLKITANGDMQIDAIIEIIRKKIAARNQSQKLLDVSLKPVESNMKTTKEVPFVHGLSQDKAKTITKLIQAKFPKAKTQIQGEEVRVSSSSKDDLQSVMQMISAEDLDFPVSFNNFR
jgi:uncharacterized protein YajQ (UPF0234 family)